jgi:hypothetical protein
VGIITASAAEPHELSRTNLEFRLRLLVARQNMSGGNQIASERALLVCHGLFHEGGQKEAIGLWPGRAWPEVVRFTPVTNGRLKSLAAGA